MDWKKLTLSLVAASAVALVGCGDDGNGGTPDGGGNDAQVDGGGNPDGGGSCTLVERPTPDQANCEAGGDEMLFVVSTLDFGQPDPMNPELGTPGFNIDDECTSVGDDTGCGAMDYTYDVDGDGTPDPGIDNQLAGLAGTLSSFLDIQEQVGSGTILILAQIQNVDDATSPAGDPCVTMNLLLGQLPAGADEGDTDGDGVINYLDADPADADVTAFKTDVAIEIDPASYVDGDPMNAPLITAQAAINAAGRVIAGPVDITLNTDVSGTAISLTVHNASVAFDISPTGVENGIIGGGLNINELVDTVVMIPGVPLDAAGLHSFLDGSADLDPVADPDGGMPMCQAISAGLTFGGTPATLPQ